MTFGDILRALLRRWKLIALGTLLTGVIALVVSFLTSPMYEARATLAIAKSTVSVSFEESIRTQSEEEQSYLLRRAQDLEARRQALGALVVNATIAQKVAARLEGQLPEEKGTPRALLGAVEGSTEGDAVVILAHASDPDIVALIANTWAEEYETHINSIYATTVGVGSLASLQAEAADAWEEYSAVQDAFERFMSTTRIDEYNRLIDEKRSIIATLSQGKTAAVATLVETELEATARIMSAYINAQADSLLLAFQKERSAKEQILAGYFAAELENRLLALQKDRQLREEAFKTLVDAEIRSRTQVFEQQIDDRVQRLAAAYARRRTLSYLAMDTRALRQQVDDGSSQDSGIATGVAILLLKAQAFASMEDLPGNLELSFSSADELAGSRLVQSRELEGLIMALEGQIEELDHSIEEQSKQLLENSGYSYLDYAYGGEDALSIAIRNAYADLYSFGPLEELGRQDYSETPLLATIMAKYPELFELGEIAGLSTDVSMANPLAMAAEELSKKLLQLQGLEQIPEYTAATEPLAEAINKLDAEVNALEAELEAENAAKRELIRARDLAWQKYDTLAAKATEVDVAAAITGIEVRLAGSALPPSSPVSPKKKQNAVLGLFVGFILSIGFVLIIEHPAVKELRQKPSPRPADSSPLSRDTEDVKPPPTDRAS
jgi:capsular polysaccharide biosynthesis protein